MVSLNYVCRTVIQEWHKNRSVFFRGGKIITVNICSITYLITLINHFPTVRMHGFGAWKSFIRICYHISTRTVNINWNVPLQFQNIIFSLAAGVTVWHHPGHKQFTFMLSIVAIIFISWDCFTRRSGWNTWGRRWEGRFFLLAWDHWYVRILKYTIIASKC